MSKSFNHKNYSIISLIQWIPVSSTGKVSDSYIRDLDIYIYNAFLDTTWKGVYFLRKIFIVKKIIYLHGNTLQMLLKLMDYTWEKIEC